MPESGTTAMAPGSVDAAATSEDAAHRGAAPARAPLETVVAAEVLRAEVRAWGEKIGVQPREIHVRRMRRKWGSCSSTGRLTLNAELFAQPALLRAEVIVHELVHLRYPNHGPMFRSVVHAYLDAGA